MSALYQMRYQGVAGNGHGAMYIGKGVVVGIDISGARFNGTYTLSGTTIDGTATLTSAGGALVTGQDVPAGGTVPITFSLPAGFDDGQYHQVVGRRQACRRLLQQDRRRPLRTMASPEMASASSRAASIRPSRRSRSARPSRPCPWA